MKMKNRILILIWFSFFFVFSCSEDYDSFPEINSVTLVVNGCITDENGPYRIRLFEDIAKGHKVVESYPVLDARLSIIDNMGNYDELKPLWEEQIVEFEYEDNSGNLIRSTYLLMPKYDGSYDSLRLQWGINSIEDYHGIYFTTSTVGKPGDTYTINISYKNQSYTATDRMPFATALDSVVLRNDGKHLDGKESDTFDVPYLYFKKPELQESYFLLTHTKGLWHPIWGVPIPQPQKFEEILLNSIQRKGETWLYDVVSDRFMSSYVSGFKLTGATSDPKYTGTDEGFFDGFDRWTYADFYLVSVSREACLYFQALSDQFYQDGGAFSPAPATPPTNLSNGAQGFFMAAAVDQKRVVRDIF